MIPNPLINFEIQKYYQKEPKYDGVYSRNNLHKIKKGSHVIHLNEFRLIGTHWIALYVNGNNRKPSSDARYFDSFGVEHIPKEVKKFIGNKKIISNIYRIQAYDSTMCGYFCRGFIDFVLRWLGWLKQNYFFVD